MEKKISKLTLCFVFLSWIFTLSLLAGDSNQVDFMADCDGFVISGTSCADWSLHDGINLTYDLEVNGDPVSGSSTIMFDSDIYECLPFEITGDWEKVFCGDVIITGSVSAMSINIPSVGKVFELDVSPFFCACGCTRSPGYYKKASHWPDGVESLFIGGVEYSKDYLVDYLKKPVRGDMDVKLMQHLIAAMLNVMSDPGENAALVEMHIDAANAYLENPAGCDKYCAEAMKDALDEFNNSGESWCDDYK